MASPGRDPDYKSPGIKLFIHSGIGFFPVRKVRVAVSVQIGKHILSDEQGMLCFFATAGHCPNTRKIFKETGRKEPIDVIPFNEAKDWFRDFYDLLWTLWDKKLESNIYLIV